VRHAGQKIKVLPTADERALWKFSIDYAITVEEGDTIASVHELNPLGHYSNQLQTQRDKLLEGI
jgi:hypothetical protein